AAETPNMDSLAARGITGLVRPLESWVPVGTQVGSALLMGLAPADLPSLTRGPVEAAGVGMSLAEGNVALRCNFATLESNGVGFTVVDRRAGRIDRGTVELAEALDGMELFGGVKARFRASTEHRAVLTLEGEGLSADVTDTDPGSGNGSAVPASRALREGDEDAERTAALVNEFVYRSSEVLSDHAVNMQRIGKGLKPANGVLTRGAGSVVELRNYVRYLGLRASVIAGEGTVRGLANLFDFSLTYKAEFTASTNTDLDEKVAATLVALERSDVVFLHIKGPDVAAHDKDPQRKRDFLQSVDRALEPLMSRDIVFAITGDHSTDSNSGRHTGDGVPALIAVTGNRTDSVQSFGETTCATGGLGHLSSTAFLTAVMDHMQVLHNYRGYEDDFLR
ncbi:MAG: phosphoglycerate mutase, partial [Rhodothermia bacterium]|nr:phosphoglycerate mutase [Rhodothermia bacterium]